MLKYMRKNRAIAVLSIGLLVVQFFAGLVPVKVSAAAPDSLKDTMTRHKISTLSSHKIAVNTATGTQWAANETLTIDFGEDDSMFTVAGASTVAADFDTTDGTTTYAHVAACDATVNDIQFAVNDTTGVVALTMCTGSASTASGATITIDYGTSASGGTNRVTNAGTAGSKEIVVAGTYGDDSAELDVPVVDDDQVTITAAVDTFITFDLDVANNHGDSNAPYSLSLGELVYSSITDEDTSGVSEIYVDLDTNALSGAVVEVVSAQGANGLSSTVASDNIPSPGTTATQSTGGGYGLGVENISGLTADTDFDDASPAVGGLTTSWQEIFTTGGTQVAGGSGQVSVRARAGTLTTAADDYTDTLTFRATATF